jgi:hypothetical protein
MQDFVPCIAIGDFKCVLECTPAEPFSPEAKTSELEARENQLKAGSYLFRFVAILHYRSEVSSAVRFLNTGIDLRLPQIRVVHPTRRARHAARQGVAMLSQH